MHTKTQENTEETQLASESNSDMAKNLKISNCKKATLIGMLRALLKKKKAFKRRWMMEILRRKCCISDIKKKCPIIEIKTFNGLINRLEGKNL